MTTEKDANINTLRPPPGNIPSPTTKKKGRAQRRKGEWKGVKSGRQLNRTKIKKILRARNIGKHPQRYTGSEEEENKIK